MLTAHNSAATLTRLTRLTESHSSASSLPYGTSKVLRGPPWR